MAILVYLMAVASWFAIPHMVRETVEVWKDLTNPDFYE